MPQQISNWVPSINTFFSIVIFVIAVTNVVIKKDDEKMKKFNPNMTVLILIILTALIQLYFTYFAQNHINKSSASLLIVNTIASMWLISLIKQTNCTKTQCDEYEKNKEKNEKELFFKNFDIMTAITTGAIMLVSIYLLYYNNRNDVDATVSYIASGTSNFAKNLTDKTTSASANIAHLARNKAEDLKKYLASRKG